MSKMRKSLRGALNLKVFVVVFILLQNKHSLFLLLFYFKIPVHMLHYMNLGALFLFSSNVPFLL